MNQLNNTTKSRKNKYLTEKERYQIEALKKARVRNAEIAIQLDKSERTIRREINRGKVTLLNSDLTYRTEYCADVAQRKYEENAAGKGPALKIGNDHKLAKYIEDKIVNEGYSPDAVIGMIKEKKMPFKNIICTKTLYNYIDKGVFLNLRNTHLLVKKRGTKSSYRKIARPSLNNLKGRSIEDRPEKINLREEIGHWEMDCVVSGRGSKTVLLVLTERMSRKTIIKKMTGKTQAEVKNVLDGLERTYRNKFKQIFKSITMDNGCEFLDHEGIEKSIITKKKRTITYYAHPYSSWERGSNENTNKIIRRFVPKGVNINDYSKKQIERVEKWINNYPRKILAYKTSEEVFRCA